MQGRCRLRLGQVGHRVRLAPEVVARFGRFPVDFDQFDSELRPLLRFLGTGRTIEHQRECRELFGSVFAVGQLAAPDFDRHGKSGGVGQHERQGFVGQHTGYARIVPRIARGVPKFLTEGGFVRSGRGRFDDAVVVFAVNIAKHPLGFLQVFGGRFCGDGGAGNEEQAEGGESDRLKRNSHSRLPCGVCRYGNRNSLECSGDRD